MALSTRDFARRAIGHDDVPKLLRYAPVLDTLLRNNDPRLVNDVAIRFVYGMHIACAYLDANRQLNDEQAVGIARDCVADSVKRL